MQKEQILNLLTMEQVLQKYAPCKITHGRCDCPIHGGDKCFAIYKNSFYCFSCGAGGDLIKFVSVISGTGYREAMLKLDADFGLNLFKKLSVKERHKLRAENEKRQSEQDKVRVAKQLNAKAYNALCAYFKELKEMYPDADIVEQAYITNSLLDLLYENEEFFFDYEKLLNAMRERTGGADIVW